MAKNYDGPVVFVEGVHYPAVESNEDEHKDENGVNPHHADLSRPLRWVEGTTYRDAEEDEPSHSALHALREVAIEPLALVTDIPGRKVYPAGIHVHGEVNDKGKMTYYLYDDNDVPQRDHPLEWDGSAQVFVSKEGE